MTCWQWRREGSTIHIRHRAHGAAVTEPTAAHREQARAAMAQAPTLRNADAIADVIAAAIAAAEKRGEGRIRAKVEALANRMAGPPAVAGYAHVRREWADRLRAAVAPEEPQP